MPENSDPNYIGNRIVKQAECILIFSQAQHLSENDAVNLWIERNYCERFRIVYSGHETSSPQELVELVLKTA